SAEIRYSYMLPVPVIVKDAVSINDYGEKKKVIHKEEILEVSDPLKSGE
ncbi:hypothetical protein LCGC14_2123770, partial [marine sediment metagenome]